MALVKHKVIASESDDSNDSTQDSPPRPKRKAKASVKQSQNNKENLDKAEAAFLKAQKKLDKLKKAHKVADKERDEAPPDGGPESEDEDDLLNFSTLIRPLTPVNDVQTLLRHTTVHQIATGSSTWAPTTLIMQELLSTSVPSPQTSLCTPISQSGSYMLTSLCTPISQSGSHMLHVALVPDLKLLDALSLSDFADAKVQSLLSPTNQNYEAHILTKDAFPAPSVQAQWVGLLWDEVQKEGQQAPDGSPLLYELTTRMVRLVKAPGSHVRGIFVIPARNAVKEHFHFVSGKSPQWILKNMELVKSLIDDTKYYFHYKDPKTQAGYCDHPIIIDILAEVCFADKSSFGVLYKEAFKPMPLATLAFIFVIIYHCIKEWETSIRVKTAFTKAAVRKHYEVYLADLEKWAKINTTATTKKHDKMFQHAWYKGGVDENVEPQPQLIGEVEERVCKELEAYLGDSGSDNDDDRDSDNVPAQ